MGDCDVITTEHGLYAGAMECMSSVGPVWHVRKSKHCHWSYKMSVQNTFFCLWALTSVLARPFWRGGCLFTQSHVDHVIVLQDERSSLHIDEGQSLLKAGDMCTPPQVRKLYK